jgi:tetratricopeptide (TPR) repeat protein
MQADMRLVEKDYAGAISLCDRAVASDPVLPAAYLERAIARRGQGDYERALADLDHAMHLGMNGSRAYYEWARTKVEWAKSQADGDPEKLATAFGRGDPYHIVDTLDKAVVIDGMNMDGPALLLHGAVLLMQSRDADAEKDFERFLRKRPSARSDLADAAEKWKRERPILDLAPVDELGRIQARRN